MGPKLEVRMLEALAREAGDRPRPSLLLNRARELTGAVAAALDGTPAGDARRWCDACEHLAVVCAASDPEPLLARFAVLPQIVAVLERVGRRATGLTIEGVPIELCVADPDGFGTALLRETGSAAYVAALGPLPEASEETAVYGALGLAWCPPGAARGARRERARRARRPRADPRRSPLSHDVVGRAGERRRDGSGRRGSRL